jgi:hypothetical protein
MLTDRIESGPRGRLTRRGESVELPDDEAHEYVRRGQAVAVELETASVAPPVCEGHERTRPKRKRRKAKA